MSEPMTYDSLVEQIMTVARPVRIVAVDGPGGAGKSTFARRLARAAGGAPVVPTDDFASWDDPIDWWPRLLEQVIQPLAAGSAARYQRFDWAANRLAEWITIDAGPIVVVEGVSSGRLEWRDQLAFVVWIDTDRDTRLRRGLDRDGDDQRQQWETWMATEDEHFALHRTRLRADVVVDGDPERALDAEREFVVASLTTIGRMATTKASAAGAPSVSFSTTLSSFGNNTGIEVPPALLEQLGAGQRPPVLVDVNGHQFRSTVGVMKGKHLVGVSSAIRKETGLQGGDAIDVTLTLATTPCEVGVPADFAAALAVVPEAAEFFAGLSNSLQRYHVDNINGAKTDETRQRRIEKAVALFVAGKQR